MSDSAPKTSNVPEFSVGELAFSLKKTLEENYGHVRVRGELSRVSIAGSGHMYSSLKDDNAVIDAVCWKGTLNKLSIHPEEGLEVICTGRISSYPKSSKYQLVIESMELAGEGALLKMLEERRKKLAAEGLFAEERKKPLPFLPKRIGIVTSPTGAVIRDILHRLDDRFPRHVLLWPVLVQGDGAADQVTAAIHGFNAMPNEEKPDLLIVGRGGGSLEDLMAFNEENVVRAIAECDIPVISAVGHETDTTLADYAADLRAPTPTGAAEKAVPVRAELYALIMDDEKRLFAAMQRLVNDAAQTISNVSARLGDPARLMDIHTQRLDHLSDKLKTRFADMLSSHKERLLKTALKLPHPKDRIAEREAALTRWQEQLSSAGNKLTTDPENRLNQAAKLLEAYSFKNVLERGFTVVRDQNGKLVSDAKTIQANQSLEIQFKDDARVSVVANSDQPPPKKASRKKKPAEPETTQTSLF